MPPFLTDENFRRAIIRGLLQRLPEIDLARVQDAGLRTASDATILAWAAEHRMVLLTRDRETMPGFAIDRVRRGEFMPGVVIVEESLANGRTIDDLVLMIGASLESEWENHVRYIPV